MPFLGIVKATVYVDYVHTLQCHLRIKKTPDVELISESVGKDTLLFGEGLLPGIGCLFATYSTIEIRDPGTGMHGLRIRVVGGVPNTWLASHNLVYSCPLPHANVGTDI